MSQPQGPVIPVPPIVNVAFNFTAQMQQRMTGRTEHVCSALSTTIQQYEPRDLTKQEQAAYDAALQVLRNFFHGEMDYGEDTITADANKPSAQR